MRFGDAEADRQAEPRALAHRLGREEGLEHAACRAGRHARPVVGDLEKCPAVVLPRANRDRPCRSGRPHRVLGVQQQVHDDLLHLLPVGDDERHVHRVLLQHRDGARAVVERSERERRSRHIVEIRDRALERLAAREEEQAVNDLRRAARVGANLLEVRAHVWARLRVDQQLAESHHRLQRVVDLVRDAGDELPHRRQPLAVNQLFLQPAFLGDVLLHRDDVRRPPVRIDDRRDRRAHRKRGAVLARAHHGAAPSAAQPRHRLNLVARHRLVRQQLRRAERRELLARPPHGFAERGVRVAAAALRRHHDDQLARLLEDFRHQLHRAARLLQLRALGGDARDEQRQHGDERHRRRQIAEALRRFVGDEMAQPEIEKGQQRDGREDHPRPRPRQLLVLAFVGERGVGRRRRRRRPREEGERQDPREVVHEPAAVQARRDLDVAQRERREADERAEREPAVGLPPRRLPRDDRRGEHRDHDEQLLQLRHELELRRHRAAGAGVGRRDEERIQESGDDGEPGDVDRGGRGERLARAAMRLREEREERRHRAEQREHGGPGQPRVAREHQLVRRPPAQPDRRHRETERDRRPEEPLAAAPRVAAPHDDEGARHRRDHERGGAEPSEHDRLIAQEPAHGDVAERVQDAEQQPEHGFAGASFFGRNLARHQAARACSAVHRRAGVRVQSRRTSASARWAAK